jgi:DNA invertase Pin-like site-specific DNA recombinase
MEPAGQRVGYVRVSTEEQSAERQLESETLDRVFTDRASGSTTERPQLQAMLLHVREGDTVFVHSIDRLARSLADLLALVRGLVDRGVCVVFVTERLNFGGGPAQPMTTLSLHLMAAFAEFERAILLERQREGIAIARRNGKYKGGKPRLSEERAAEFRVRCAVPGANKSEIAREFGISRSSAHRYLHRHGEKQKWSATFPRG